MTATHISEVTNEAIATELAKVKHMSVSTSGSTASRVLEELDRQIVTPTVQEVRDMLERHWIAGEDATEEIRMAISIAAEPEDMPSDCAVEVIFND